MCLNTSKGINKTVLRILIAPITGPIKIYDGGKTIEAAKAMQFRDREI